MIVLAIICILVLGLLIGLVEKSISRSREVHSRLESAQKYLGELDYEQAIAEYEAILAIVPNNQQAQELLGAGENCQAFHFCLEVCPGMG